MKKAKKQVLEAPQKYSYKSSGFNYFRGDYSGSYLYPTWDYEKPADHRREVELNLEDLNYIIGEHDVSIDQGLNFVDEFGIESFLDLVDYAISGELDINWFKRVMTDYKLARESFPALGRVVS